MTRQVIRNKIFSYICGAILLVLPTYCSYAQDATSPDQYFMNPETLNVLGISVEGASDEYTRGFVLQTSRITVGQTIGVPGDPSFGEAIRAIYRLRTYEDVQIAIERRVGNGVFLVIRVKEVAKLREYSFEGISGGDKKDLKKKVPLITRSAVSEGAIARSEQVIKEFYEGKGRSLTTVHVNRITNDDNTISLEFVVDRGPKVTVKEVIIHGNEKLSTDAVKSGLKTKPRIWWQFWSRPTYKKEDLNADLQKIVQTYNERGYYNSRVVADTSYLWVPEHGDPKMVVEITVVEGEEYFIRNINWAGNTIYSDARLSVALDMMPGQPYNAKKLIENIHGAGKKTDVTSLYMSTGYMGFRIDPKIRVIGKDSLDLEFEIIEGDVFTYGDVLIGGNTKTREHVVRRELTTIPGNTFNRDHIEESIRRLMQLNYFTVESLGAGPSVSVNEEKKTANIKYNLVEQGSDQLELSGTWGQFGLVLQLRFGFNNFSAQNFFKGSAWKPLPSGDGQKLSLGIQTNGRRYQQYSISFTEPWFRGRPTPLGGSLSYSRVVGISGLGNVSGGLYTFSVRTFYQQRMKWPDPFFRTSTTLGYQYYDNQNYISTLPLNVSREVTIKQSISRSSVNHPLFPSSGSKFEASVEVAPPFKNFIQYHKWAGKMSWYMPLSNKLSISMSTYIGYIGSITGELVLFERFIVGGSPFETQGYYNFFGKEIVYMRGYPLGSIGPRLNNDPFGGRVLNKFTSELLWMAIRSPTLQAAPYLFLDGANTWNSVYAYNPTDLFRSAGFGTRLFLPILGMVELTYGYNLDPFIPINSKHTGSKQWTFQFSLGQGFGQ